jgi:hypothetical protein
MLPRVYLCLLSLIFQLSFNDPKNILKQIFFPDNWPPFIEAEGRHRLIIITPLITAINTQAQYSVLLPYLQSEHSVCRHLREASRQLVLQSGPEPYRINTEILEARSRLWLS